MRRAWIMAFAPIVRIGIALAPIALIPFAQGCAGNAIFELEVELPAQPEGAPLFAVIGASTIEGFAWETPPPLEGIALPPSCARTDPAPPCEARTLDPVCSAIVSVVAHDAHYARPLNVRARFCRDPRCEAAEDASAPEHRVEVERAFYAGRYTQARTCIDDVPVEPAPTPERIERCDVRCREGTTSMSCRLDGTHFCEPPLER